jgi:hypothetical protein
MHVGRTSTFAVGATIALVVVAGCGAAPGPAATDLPTSSDAASGAATDVTPTPSGASILEVECTTTGIKLAADTVTAQADGVHFLIGNSSGEEREFELDGVGGDAAPREATAAVWIVAPGAARARCQPLDGGADAAWVAFTVVDPAVMHVPDRVTCALMSSLIVDYAGNAPGLRGDPVEIARSHLRGVHDGDVVERAGYPDTDNPKVRVVRDGEVLAVVTYEPALGGGWHMSMFDSCSGANVMWDARGG